MSKSPRQQIQLQIVKDVKKDMREILNKINTMAFSKTTSIDTLYLKTAGFKAFSYFNLFSEDYKQTYI